MSALGQVSNQGQALTSHESLSCIHKNATILKVMLVAGVILGIGLAIALPFIAPMLETGIVVTLAIAGGLLVLASSITLLTLGLFAPHGRLLPLEGEKGTVFCRVSRDLSRTLPRFSENWMFEFATRTLLWLKNLVAVRGVPGSSMVGPCDFFGVLGQLHKFLYDIDLTVFPPKINRKPIPENSQELPALKDFDNTLVTPVEANWVAGQSENIQVKQAEYNLQPQHLQQSLFLKPGLLEIDRAHIELKNFDPRGVDLSSFKARLVDNSVPFQITKKPLPPKDDYRLVTYRYESGYADWQIREGSGLFLEKHSFSQTITPITADSKGFVVLARFNENDKELEMIGIQIPFGHTLIIEEGCIHGDTSLNGFYMMGMTSAHTTMRTADTVFLKDKQTKKNAEMSISGIKEGAQSPISLTDASVPYVAFANASKDERKVLSKLTKDKSIIFNPFNSEYWRLLAG